MLSHINRFFSSLTIDSLFNRLESINIQQIEPDLLIPFLTNLASLPRLSSLTIYARNVFKNSNKIYRLIFALPMLTFHEVAFINNNRPVTLAMATKLTYLSIYGIFIPFDQLEMFIKNIHCLLKVLHIITRSEDITYLDADRWERLISQNLPQLEEFQFQYYEETNERNTSLTYLGGPNQFSSSFWIT
jgi:hypothetical protein